MLKSDRFAPNFVWNHSLFWVFLKGVKIKVLFVSALLLTKSYFCTEPAHGESYENGACFCLPPFLSGTIYPKNSYLANLPFGGKKWKCLLPPMVYWDFYRHFTLKNHQFLPRSWGKIKKRWPFFQLSPKILWSFFTKPLHKGFFDAFCHCPDHCRNRRDTPLKTQKNF